MKVVALLAILSLALSIVFGDDPYLCTAKNKSCVKASTDTAERNNEVLERTRRAAKGVARPVGLNKDTRGTRLAAASNSPAEILEKIRRADKKVGKRASLNEDFRIALGADYNWEHLLSPAPLGIAILGNLMFMAGSMKDFAIDLNAPKEGFKFIKYPKSFRTNLVQISHAGYRAFKTAHVNMDKIRLHTHNVPGYMQSATKLLTSRKIAAIQAFLPDEIANILQVANECSRLSTEVVKDFEGVINLTLEVIEACTSTRGEKEHLLAQAIEEIQILKMTANASQEIIQSLREDKKRFEKEVDEANAAVTKAAEETPTLFQAVAASLIEKIGDVITFQFLSSKTSAESHTKNKDESPNPNPMPREEMEFLLSQQLNIDRIHGLSKKYMKRLENATNLNSFKEGKFNCDKDLQTLEKIQKNSNGSPKLEEVCSTGIEFFHTLQNVSSSATLTGVVDDFLRQAAAEFYRTAEEIHKIVLENCVPIKYQTTPPKKENPSKDVVTNAVEAARHKSETAMERLKMAREAADKTRDIMMKKNEEHIALLAKMQKLDVEKVDYDEAIQLLHQGLLHLSELKDHWTKLVIFFQRIATIVEVTLNTGLTSFNNYVSKASKNPALISSCINQIHTQAIMANQAAYMVYCMSDTYGKVSSGYIMDSITQLDRLMVVDNSNRQEVERLRDELSASCTKASEEIIVMIQKDKNEMIEKMVARMNQVEEEYAFLKELPPDDEPLLLEGEKDEEEEEE